VAQPAAPYGAGAAVGSTGVTPGGLGLVELAAAAALAAGGLSGPGPWQAVPGYRIVRFRLVVLTGWVITLLLGAARAHRPDERW